jgi:protein O-GlcNAc transferase
MPIVPEIFSQAVRLHQGGELGQAENLYRQVLHADPRHPHAWHMLGVLAGQVGRRDLAVEYIGQALRILPDYVVAHNDLGTFLRSLGRLDEAEACFRQALRLQPDVAAAHNNFGNFLRERGQQDEAEAHYNLGNVWRDRCNLQEAEACYREALRLKPGIAPAWNNLGLVLRDRNNREEAEADFRAAIRLKPDYVEAHSNLGNLLRDEGRLDEAEACLRQALRLKPDLAEAHNNLGIVLRDQGQLEEAKASYRQALRLKQDYVEAHNNLGNAFRDQGQIREAEDCYRQALRLKPDFASAHSNLLYALIFSPDHDAQAIFAEHQRWNRQHAEPLARHIEPHDNDRSPERRLRIGYMSPDFCSHAESFFTVPLLSAHDRQAFEIFCYADVVRPDEVTTRLRSHANAWRNICGLSDEQVARLVRQDRIDILVDLTMHMARNHLLVFARKPAPIQVCWLAYQGTTGLGTMDYRLTDPIIDPPGLYDLLYSEESVRLPDAFWCYDPLESDSQVRALPALAKGHITFGCLNNFCKVNDPVLRLWAKVLTTVRKSRLILLAAEGSHRQHTLDLLEQEGVRPERVIFVSRMPRPRYLELYNEIDVGLDTFPYTGQTTSLDAFWLGVPVITLVGNTAVARAGRSLLENLGLPELVAATPEQFVSIASQLAGDLPRLEALRAGLRDRLRQSPLMDAPRFARSMEAAFRTMWQRWCEKS